MELTRRPYDHNFTGNPIIYEFLDNDAIANPTISFQVKVMARRLDASVFSEVGVSTLSPFQGRASVNIASLLHTLLQHYLPTLNAGTTVYNSGTAGCEFYIHYRTITTDNIETGWNTTEINYLRMGFKGGVHPYRYRGNAFFTSYVPGTKPFYSWQKREKLASYNERIYLNWLNLLYNYAEFAPQAFLKLKTEVFFTDQSSTVIEYNVPLLQKGYMNYLPAGAAQLNLLAVNPAKKLWAWQCWLQDVSVGGLGIITEKFSFVLDQRNDYNQFEIIYRNSLGGLDTVRLRGVIIKNLEYESTLLEKSAAPDAPEAATAPTYRQYSNAVETLRYRADIGWLGKEEQDRLRDAMLQREAYIVKFGRWMPISIANGSGELTRTDAFTWRMPIEFTLADSGSEFYTPESVDLGAAVPSTNTCGGAVVFGVITQFPNDPSAGLTRVRFNFAVVGIGTFLQWRVPGFVDDWQTIPFVASGFRDYTVSSDVQFTMQMRVQCTPTVFGEISEQFVDTNPAPPAANSTIYNETNIASIYTLKVNGTPVRTGSLPASGYVGIYFAPVATATIEIELASISPAEADLFIVDTTYVGSIAGNKATWINRTTTSAGITITIR